MTETLPDTIATRIINGDLAELDDNARVLWYSEVCRSLGLNPATRPFQFITLNGRLTLYATKDATDQLRRRDQISTEIVDKRDTPQDLYIVTARATRPDGRHDESTGVVSLKGLSGEIRANAMMKAETKAKRRATLSICGLGFLDETEVADIPGAGPSAASPGPGADQATRDHLETAINALPEVQREWLKGWVRNHDGPDGKPWPNIRRREFTAEHAEILAAWVAMAAEYAPPCETDG